MCFHTYDIGGPRPLLRRIWRGFSQIQLSKPTVWVHRPEAGVWSGLEYGCHVRDVFTLYDERLVMMLDQDGPLYPNWDQNETAIAKSYEDEDPVMVAADLGIEAHRLADRFDALQGKDWERAGTRSDGARFTIETFAGYLVHDPVHHVHDVKKGYQKLASL